jgi:hypothetical protein
MLDIIQDDDHEDVAPDVPEASADVPQEAGIPEAPSLDLLACTEDLLDTVSFAQLKDCLKTHNVNARGSKDVLLQRLKITLRNKVDTPAAAAATAIPVA